ncbi:DUF6783 domain-containing protein [Anaerobutyricum hallii]
MFYNTTANEYVLSWNIFAKCFLQIAGMIFQTRSNSND